MPTETLRLSSGNNEIQSWTVTSDEAARIHEAMTGPDRDKILWLRPAPPQTRTVHQRIVQAMRAVSHVAKDGFNQHFKYPFRGIDGVTNALGPALREAGVFVAAEILDNGPHYRDGQTKQGEATREVTVRVRYTFWGEDGDSVESEGVGESIDQSDKGTAKAMSVALRVALLGVFLLPTQEPTTDHDGHYHQRGDNAPLSAWERNAGLALLANPTPEQAKAAGPEMLAAALRQALDFRACIEEHAAWLQPSTGEESPTWEELFSARIAWEIGYCKTGRAARALWELLKTEGLDMAWEGVKFSQLLKDRVAAVRVAQAKLVDDLTGGVIQAVSHADLDHAWTAVVEARTFDRITEEQLQQVHQVAQERRARLASTGGKQA